MERGEQGGRQRSGFLLTTQLLSPDLTCRASYSGLPSANSLEHLDRRPRERVETSYREGRNMATTLISPAAPYSHHQHYNSSSSGYPHSAPATSIPGIVSPVEVQRPSDDSKFGHAHRQSLPSLPSISEMISEKKPPGYDPPPSSASMPPNQSLPSPYPSSVAPRLVTDIASPDKDTSPRTLISTSSSSSFPRADPLPPFSDPARPILASRPVPPPLNTYTGQSVKREQLEAEQRHAEAQALSAGSRPQPAQPLPGLYAEPGRLPPGQLPLFGYPYSPRPSVSSGLPSPFSSRNPPPFNEEAEYSHPRPSKYKADFDKHFQTYGYQDALQAVSSQAVHIRKGTAG
jgi:hypothetical protein